jgi:hypothetical protein
MPSLSQSDVQEHLQRFQARFSAWLADALEPLATHRDPRLRRAALDLQLRLSSAALDIAIGRSPDASLLDMVTLMELSKATLVEHWVPQVFRKQQAGPLIEAMEKSCEDVWQVARQVLSPPEEADLRRIIEHWKASNPDQLHVASMRLPAFASPADAGFGSMNAQASGLFSGVKKAVQAADQTRLLAERALYAAQRLPFLLRIQARLTGQQIVDDLQITLAPTLATARQAFRGALVASAGIGIFWLLLRLTRR